MAHITWKFVAVARDEDLPAVHALLLKASKGRTYGVFNSQFAKCAVASALLLTLATAPVATTKLVKDLF